MVDWPGLLKWSLKHSDGTRSTDLKPMDEETKRWLAEAFEHYTIDEGKVLRELTGILAAPEQGNSPTELEAKLSAMDRIEDLIENMEASRTLVKVGGLQPLVKTMLGSTYIELRLRSARIFSSSAQNNPAVQKAALDYETLDGLMFAAEVELNSELREAYIGALSALVRGELLDTRVQFIAKKGLKIIADQLASPSSLRAHKKVLLLLLDLLYREAEAQQPDFVTEYREYDISSLLQQGHQDTDVQELSTSCLNAAVGLIS
jgi:hsp70-interacting protein